MIRVKYSKIVWFALIGLVSSALLVPIYHFMEASSSVNENSPSFVIGMLVLLPFYLVSYAALIGCFIGGIILMVSSIRGNKIALRDGFISFVFSIINLMIMAYGGVTLSA